MRASEHLGKLEPAGRDTRWTSSGQPRSNGRAETEYRGVRT